MLAVALVATASSSVGAQRLGPPVARPQLRDVTDTNDAHAYYNLGLSLFDKNPEEAASAFYWAARIDPIWGEPLYALRAARLMTDRGLLRGSMEGDRRTLESAKMRRLDSLDFRALMLDPFLYRRLDRQMLTTYLRAVVTESARQRGESLEAAGGADYAIEVYLRNSGERTRGWLAYGSGNFPKALEHYSNALTTADDKAGLRLERARILAMQHKVENAVAEFNLALQELRKVEQKDLVVFYNSKALTEYSVAVILEGVSEVSAAKEAYARALQEDLAFYPAHLRLGLLALGLHDTTTAVGELSLAAQLAPNEPYVRYVN